MLENKMNTNMFTITELEIEGCYLLTPRKLGDNRGSFIKIFHNEFYKSLGLQTEFNEEYYSISKPGVIRGMHFQTPPQAHEKIVTCIRGEILDVLVDIRKNSKTFGEHIKIKLTESNKNIIYIPKGIAHGFCAKGNNDAIMLYKTSTVFCPECDGGIAYDSLGIDWEIDKQVIISERDERHPRLEDFKSPF